METTTSHDGRFSGTGPTLAEISPWLRDAAERHRRILEVAERNSVIEGLPPFTIEVRERIAEQLRQVTAVSPAPEPRG